MTPATYNLDLYRGDTSRWQFKLWTDAAKTIPSDLTGVTAAAMIRDKAPGGVYSLALGCVVTLPNIIDMELTPGQSRDLPVKGVWDLQLTYASGDIITVLKGSVSVTQDITSTDLAGKKPLAVVR